MEKLFELTFQDQTLNPQVGTFTDASQTTGTFTLEDGEYYLTNADTKGFYAYAPIAIQPDSETDNKVTVEFDLKVAAASVNTHTIIGTYAGVDGSGIPTGAKITLQYNAGDIELVLGSGTTETLIAAADVVVDQWYHFRIDCALDAPTESTCQVKIDGVLVTTVTGATTDYELGIIGVLGTDLHACDECGIKNIRLITDDDYFVGRTALNQAFTDTKGYVDAHFVPIAGTNALSGNIVPSTDNAVDIGASSKNIKMLYAKGITINGTQFLPSDYIPRSGGAVLSGEIYARAVDNSFLNFAGGSNFDDGAIIQLVGKDFSDNDIAGRLLLQPRLGTNVYKTMNMLPSGTWTWTGTAVQLISDQRYKQQISEIDDKLLDAWSDVDLVQFKYNDAVDQKGDNARLHTGYVVQQIDKACKSHGVDISGYGLYCHEEYAEETKEVEHEDGTKTIEVVRPASEHYSLRYTEALIVECAYLRKKNKQLQEQLDKLSARLDKLEGVQTK